MAKSSAHVARRPLFFYSSVGAHVGAKDSGEVDGFQIDRRFAQLGRRLAILLLA